LRTKLVRSSRRKSRAGKSTDLPERQAAERLGLSVMEACAIAGIGKTKLYAAIKDHRLKAKKLDARTIILRADLQDFLASLPSAA
jgi:excisionase family DNA binding protein